MLCQLHSMLRQRYYLHYVDDVIKITYWNLKLKLWSLSDSVKKYVLHDAPVLYSGHRLLW